MSEVIDTCSHSWVAGMMHVHDEDLEAVHIARSARGESIECERCETTYDPKVHIPEW